MANEQLNLQKFIVSVVIIGITLILGIYINSTVGEQLEATNYPVSIVNESNAFINGSGYTVAGATRPDFAGFSVTRITNTTDGVIVSTGNYTVLPTGKVVNSTARLWTNVRVTYSYTFTNSTPASEAALNVTNALATGTSWISILVVVGFATIILTMLTAGLGSSMKEQGAAVPYY